MNSFTLAFQNTSTQIAEALQDYIKQLDPDAIISRTSASEGIIAGTIKDITPLHGLGCHFNDHGITVGAYPAPAPRT